MTKASQTTHCLIYVTRPGLYYLELGDFEGAPEANATTYGPFPSQDETLEYIAERPDHKPARIVILSTPRETPTASPNGNPVKKVAHGVRHLSYPAPLDKVKSFPQRLFGLREKAAPISFPNHTGRNAVQSFSA